MPGSSHHPARRTVTEVGFDDAPVRGDFLR
jgi:hypothetical protein